MKKKPVFGKLASLARNYNTTLGDLLKTLEDFYNITTDEDKALELTALYYEEQSHEGEKDDE